MQKNIIIFNYVPLLQKFMLKSVVKRFIKGFLAGGTAGALLVINAGVIITSVEDLKKLGIAIIVGFITGGFLAIEKALNWTTEPPVKS